MSGFLKFSFLITIFFGVPFMSTSHGSQSVAFRAEYRSYDEEGSSRALRGALHVSLPAAEAKHAKPREVHPDVVGMNLAYFFQYRSDGSILKEVSFACPYYFNRGTQHPWHAEHCFQAVRESLNRNTMLNQGVGRWNEARFEILSANHETFKTASFGYVFLNRKNCIIKIADELNGLTGIKLPDDHDKHNTHAPLKLKFNEPVKLLIGAFHDKGSEYRQFAETKNQTLVLKNAVTVTGLPSVDVYALEYKKGTHVINLEGSGLFIVLGVIKTSQPITLRDAGMSDGKLWEPFIVEGFYNKTPLIEIIGGPDKPVLDEGMPGTEGIQGGFEGGMCVKIGDTYHLFPTERAGQQGVEAYYDRVKTRIGHWTSKDAIHWTRRSTIYQASGTYAVTDDDNPLNERRGAIWSYMPVFSEKANRWYGYYLAYTVHKEIEPNHSFGRIWRTESVKEGIDGIGGPYKDAAIIMEPGLDTQLWEGRQGVDSFFPFKVGNEWLGFYGGAYPFEKREDYPRKSKKAWYVGLAKSPTLEGPWTRLDTTVNPVTSIHPSFIENPIVYKLQDSLFITIFDGGPEAWGLHLPNMMGYALSTDGYHWSEAHYLPIQTKVKQWWTIMRTPVCLIPEGNDVYTVLYAAIDTARRFHPMGMVKVRLNRRVQDSMAGKF